MSNLWKSYAIAILLFPVAAFADISGTATVNAGSNFSLDNGTNVSSGGDISFTGTSLTFVGSAKGGSLAALGSGAAAYASLSQSTLTLLAGLATATPIPAGSLPVNTIVGVGTNGGNPAKLLITAISSASISFQYTTYESTAPNTPTITQIQNNYGLIVPGLPNYGIAPGTIFIIRGTNLASVPVSSITSLQSSAAPGIPSTLNGATITVTVGSFTAHPGMYYAGATQIAAVLPSGTPVGTGTITVSYNNATSNAQPLTVVTSALGLDTYYGGGTGLGVGTDLSYNVFNYTKSASPGQNIILWGSGLGADTADSDTTVTTTPHAVNVPLTIYVGGIAVTPDYAGSSGYPGLNQINLKIPSSVTPGCGVSIVAVSGNIVSNTMTLPIAVGGGVCTDPILGYNGTQLGTLAGKTNYNEGILFIIQSTASGKVTSDASGIFENIQTTSSTTTNGLTSVGSCNINSAAVVGSTVPTITGLDAGTITVTGPTGTQTLTTIPQAPGDYIAQLPAGFIPASGGSYTFNGTGGANVGAFSASVAYTNPLVWTNSGSDTSVNRANGVTLTWTGGATGSFGSIVYIGGTSSSSTATASFTCYAPVSAGSFTVPSYVLLALPAGSGTLGITNEANPVSFTATGLDTGILFGGVTFSINSTYN
jgi:uncharacterized protein (TIGR03437 family)